MAAPEAAAGSSSKADAAKDEAAIIAAHARDAAESMAETAKSEIANVAAEAKSNARDLMLRSRSDLTNQAGTQQHKAAEGLRAIASQLRSIADAPDQQGVASDLVRQVADRSESIAFWLGNRDPGSVLDETKSFARRRPGPFLLLAAGAPGPRGALSRRIRPGRADPGSADDKPEKPRQA